MYVSVALSTFNGHQFVSEQLASIAAQTRVPDEIVVSDDASTDQTLALVERFARSVDIPVHIKTNTVTLGVVRNFEKAIGACKGDVIFLSDQDDIWKPNKIECCLDVFSNPDVIMVFSDADIVDVDLTNLGITLSSITFTDRANDRLTPALFEFILERNIVTGMTMAFRSKVLELGLPIPTDIPETIHDGWLSLVASLQGDCVFIPERLVLYRQHLNQLVGALKVAGFAASDKEEHRQLLSRYVRDAELEIERLSVIKRHLDERILSNISAPVRRKAIASWRIEVQYWNDYRDHFVARRDMPAGRLGRIPSIIAELSNRRYFTFSSGIRSALKDVWK
jgi:glycosyltransferase involved in cell wall biosynthesis